MEPFEIEGLAEQIKMLRKMMIDDPNFRKRLKNAIRDILKEARKEISNYASGVLDNDPRKAYKAVRSEVYRSILGGQVNILQKRKAGNPGRYEKPKKRKSPRGGNRWGRSADTIRSEGYQGADRGFILRFVNAGANDRKINSYTGKDGQKHSLSTGTANRGSIAPRNWFGSSSRRALEKSSQRLQILIDRIIAQEFV